MNFKTLYLSLPITGCELQSIVEAKEAQENLEKQGFKIINPHNVRLDLEDELDRVALEREIMGADLLALSQCDAMILLPGWETSKGCNLEIRFALDYNTPIYDYTTMEKIKFNSQIKNVIQRTFKEPWITQPLHIEEPVPGMN